MALQTVSRLMPIDIAMVSCEHQAIVVGIPGDGRQDTNVRRS
jgi:hypothetical protein